MALDKHAASCGQQGHPKASCHQLKQLPNVALGWRRCQAAARGKVL